MGIHTVDSYGNTFGQFIAVGPNKRWNSPKRIELQIAFRKTVWRFGFDELEVNIVGLGDSENSIGASISLYRTCEN